MALSRPVAATLCVAALAVIGLATLTPASVYVPTPMFCVFCGTLGGVDFTLNVLLFVPLGFALRRLLGRWTTAVVIASLTTIAIETLQWRVVPGRDASLGDLIANSLGAMIGAWLAVTGPRVLRASASAARSLAVVVAVSMSLIIVVSGVLLRPIDPVGAQYVQWAPEAPNTDVFRGSLILVQLNGRLLRPFEAFPSQWTYDSLTRSMAVRAEMDAPVPPSQRQAIIIRIANEVNEGFMLAQRGDAAVYQSHTGATRLRLRPILVGLDDAFTTPQSQGDSPSVLVLHGNSSGREMSLRRELNGHTSDVTLRRTVGLAWAMFLPWSAALSPRWWPANALWLAALMAPAAFLTMRARRTETAVQNALGWSPLILVLGTVVAAPAAMGLSFLAAGEWLGVAVGLAAGVLLERALPMSLSNMASDIVVPTNYS